MTTDARVHDIRYRRDEGLRTGRRAAVWSFARWSMRRSLGAGMGWIGKAGPILIALSAFGPAIVLIGLRALFADTINFDLLTEQIGFGAYAAIVGVEILMFVALIAPRLMCADRRDRVLPLYFSTAVSRWEYLAAKLLAAFCLIGFVVTVPVLTLFLGNVLFAQHPLGYLQNHFADIGRILIGGTLMSLFWAPFGLALASLTGRVAFAVTGLVATVIGSATLAGALGEVEQLRDSAGALNLLQVPIAMYDRQFPNGLIRNEDVTTFGAWSAVYVLVIVASLAVLVWRYRTSED